MESQAKKSVEKIMNELSNEQKMLLYLIGVYSEVDGKYGKQWIKDLALKGLISKGIRSKVYDWDYAPASIMYRGSRKVINVSQEGTNDLNDLRTLGLVARLRLGTNRHFYFNAFSLHKKGIEVVKEIPQEFRKPVDEFIHCKTCGELYEIIPIDEGDEIPENEFEELDPSEDEGYRFRMDGIFMVCYKCKIKINTRLDWIEAVSYTCFPRWLKVNMVAQWELLMKKEREK
ncbi:MAG: hypothetical protein ACFFD2_00385 [Promethearchaeota archaeon]